MSVWTTPKTYSSTVLSAAEKNTYERDNITFLGADRISHRTVSATLTNVENTTTKTETVAATITPAIADGESLVVDIVGQYLNNSGGNSQFELYFSYGGVEVLAFDPPGNIASTSTVTTRNWQMVMVRNGSDAWVGMSTAHTEDGSGGASIMKYSTGGQLAAPSFAASGALSISAKHGVANASIYFRPRAARVRYLGSAST